MRDTKVALKVCKQYEPDVIGVALKDCFDLIGGLNNFIKPHHKVLIKPDLYSSTEPNIAKTTNPNVIIALAELIDNIGATCIIADSPKGDFKQSKLDDTYIKTQMLQASNNGHVSLSTNENITIITNPNGETSRDIYVLDEVNDVDVIINVAKFRCDKNLGLIGCGQNLFGLVPGKFKELIRSRCYNLKSYYNYNIDLYEALEDKIVLNVLDAVVANEANNDPRILNTILVGANPYSVDAVALKIINEKPEDSLLLKESVRRQKLDFNFDIVGDDIEPLICTDFHYATFGENIKNGSSGSFKRAYNRNQKRPIIPTNLCKGCKICVNNCPMKAISVNSGHLGEYASVDYNKCINCFKCVEICPYKIVKTKTPIKYSSIDKMIKKRLNKNK